MTTTERTVEILVPIAEDVPEELGLSDTTARPSRQSRRAAGKPQVPTPTPFWAN